MPSYGYSNYVSCPTLQEQLDQQFLYNPQMVQDPLGLLYFVNSPVNTNNTLQRQISPGGGKYRAVELVFQPRFTDASSDSAEIDCNGGPEYGNTSEVYTIDPTVGKSRPFTVTPTLLASMCESDDAWFAKQIMGHMAAIERDIDNDLAVFVASELGNFYGNPVVTSKDTSTKTSNGQFVEDLTADVVYEFQQLERPGLPFLFGNGLLNKYMRAMRAGCCALIGVDLGLYTAQNDMVFMRDKYLTTALGSEDSFVAIAPGSIQMLKYLAFESPLMRMDDDMIKQGVIQNPFSGLYYDYYAKYDCGAWKGQIKLAYKFVVPPMDQFNVNDPLYGTNGILKFNIVNP